MNEIIDFKELVRKRIDMGATNAGSKYRDAIKPIYGEEDSGKPTHIGTCVLVEIGHSRYLITAAHVFDELKHTGLYIGAHRLIPITGEFMSTPKPNNKRELDHYDFAWLKLSQDQLDEMNNVAFIKEADISKNLSSSEKRTYVALGYPNSKNKKVDLRKKSITPKFAKYTSTGKSKPNLLIKLGLSGDEHILIERKKISREPDGTIVTSFEPRGMSGGALIDLGYLVTLEELSKPDVHPGLLAGIFIEKHPIFNALLFVRMDFILHTISQNP